MSILSISFNIVTVVYVFLFSYSETYCFELYSSFYDTPHQRVGRVIFDWTVLEVKNLGAQVTWANKPMAYTNIPVEVE